MKRLRRIIISILVVSMVFGCVGCNKSKETSTHGFTAISGKYLINDGVSEYKIVIPEEASGLIQIAASEFNKFFSESTGVSLPVVSDKEIQGGDKFISIGETTLLQGTDIKHEYEELGRDGYKIITKDDNLYLIGGGEYGSLYAVYELLEYIIDYYFFAADCYTLTQGVTQIPLYDFDVTDIPDISLRMASDGVVDRDNQTLYRLRQRPYLENYVTIKNNWCHNALDYVEDSPEANRTWYNQAKNQLCYTAHGDATEYAKLLNAVLTTMKDELMKNTERESITLTMEDNHDSCDCEACKAVVEEYGTISATVILFLNDLNAMVRDWFETEEGKPYARDLRILFFAYHGYEEPPVTYNEETGKYEPNNGIKMDDGVYCMLAPISMNYYRPITDPQNAEYYNNFRGWADIADGKLYLWYYSTNFMYYLAPFDCFDSIAENYRFAVEQNTFYIFDQRQTDESGVLTGWSTLKNYLNSQLAWDASQDMGMLIDRFFDAYFGPASSEMRVMFDQMRAFTNYHKEHSELGEGSSLYDPLPIEEFWPKDVLTQWLDCYERAEAKIAVLKEKNPALYEMYYDHIMAEKLSVLYMFVECYSYNTTEEIIASYKTEFKEIADGFNLVRVSESIEISNLYEKWGIE